MQQSVVSKGVIFLKKKNNVNHLTVFIFFKIQIKNNLEPLLNFNHFKLQ